MTHHCLWCYCQMQQLNQQLQMCTEKLTRTEAEAHTTQQVCQQSCFSFLNYLFVIGLSDVSDVGNDCPQNFSTIMCMDGRMMHDGKMGS